MRSFIWACCLFPCVAPGAVPAACAELTALTRPDMTVQKAQEVPDGELMLPGMGGALQVQAFCRVLAVAAPTNDSEIHFEVWIPSGGRWNGKLLGTGNGGFAGSISYRAMASALGHGYATVGSDTGHSGDQMEFGDGHPEKIVDWAYRAVHVTTQAAQLIVRTAAGKAPAHSYFEGCSTGGQQALSEAQRYPDDYDGIIAGAPGNDRIRLILGFLWSWTALHDAKGEPLLGAPQLALLTRKVTERCDAKDGLKDGIIGDPRRCNFDPLSLVCAGTPSDTCLTREQAEAVRKVYGGARNSRTGEMIFPGWVRGSEAGWGNYLLDPREPPRLGLFRHFVAHDPTWDWRGFDWDRDVARVAAQIPNLNALSRDLSRFQARGGRLLMYTGWADPVVPPTNVVSYYESVTRAMGGSAQTRGFFRFFAFPGMGHCGGGPGFNTFDALSVLEDWVERDRAPEQILASRTINGTKQSRPVCAYPEVARLSRCGLR
jgi:feruloyl esterase